MVGDLAGGTGGAVAFLAIFGACLTVAGRLQGAWQAYMALTAVAGLAMTIWTALTYQKDAARVGLIQRGLILVYWSWIVLTSLHLITTTQPGPPV